MIPESVITEQANMIKKVTIGIVIGAIMISCLISWLIGRNITGAIKLIIRPISMTAKGDLTVNIDTTRTDEFGQLNQALDIMVANVKKLVNKAAHLGNNVISYNFV